LNIGLLSSVIKVAGMPNSSSKRLRKSHPIVAAVVPPVVAAVVQPVAKRLARIEALLFEMRFEQDVQARRISVLKEVVEALTERPSSRKGQRPESQNRPAQPANGARLAEPAASH
jgi:hypothetical protein